MLNRALIVNSEEETRTRLNIRQDHLERDGMTIGHFPVAEENANLKIQEQNTRIEMLQIQELEFIDLFETQAAENDEQGKLIERQAVVIASLRQQLEVERKKEPPEITLRLPEHPQAPTAPQPKLKLRVSEFLQQNRQLNGIEPTPELKMRKTVRDFLKAKSQ
jgi:hypothetical protein